MMQLCPKCGDYYADASLAFCLKDGTPLVEVSPRSESWRKGEQVIEEKENVLRKQKRRLKWRRVFMSVMTMLIATMIVCVVAVNSFIYLKPQPDEVVLVKPLTHASEPAEPSGSTMPSTPGGSAPTPDTITPTTTPKISATPSRKDANSNTNVNTHSNTNANANINTNHNTNINTTNNANINTNVNINHNINANININTNSDIRPPVCSDADQRRESEAIIKSFGAIWQQRIGSDRREIIAQAGQAGAFAVLSPLKYESKFLKGCSAALITARYAWQVDSPTGVVTIPKKKGFTCIKLGGAWLCR